MKYKTDFKRWLPYLIIFAVFILSAIVYFWPAVQGKVVYAGDSINGTAATQEGIRYHQETGDYSFWTGSMFFRYAQLSDWWTPQIYSGFYLIPDSMGYDSRQP